MQEQKEELRKKGDEGSETGADTTTNTKLPPAQFKNERQLDDYHKGEEFARYEALCRDEDVVVSDVYVISQVLIDQ